MFEKKMDRVHNLSSPHQIGMNLTIQQLGVPYEFSFLNSPAKAFSQAYPTTIQMNNKQPTFLQYFLGSLLFSLSFPQYPQLTFAA